MNTATETQVQDHLITISIAKDFSPFPGARYISDGPYSGEQFRETLLKPKFDEARQKNLEILIDLDGAVGFPTSFLEEAFGGLTRILKDPNLILKHLRFRSYDEPGLEREIQEYIRNANKK